MESVAYLELPWTPKLPEPGSKIETAGGHSDKFNFSEDYKYFFKKSKQEEIMSYKLIITEETEPPIGIKGADSFWPYICDV